MAKFRKIDPRIWNDRKFRELSDNAKLVFFFLLTHPHQTSVGAMRASLSGLAEEIGWNAEAFAEAFGEGLAKGMVKHDPQACFVWLPNFLKYNEPESPNVVKSWRASFDLLPECALQGELWERLKALREGMTEAFGEAFDYAFNKDFAYQEQEPEQEQEQEQEPEQDNAKGIGDETPYTEIATAWNALAEKHKLPRVTSRNESRERGMRNRWKQRFWREHWKEALGKIPLSEFLLGAKEEWKATFDFFLRPDTVTKIIEGQYGILEKNGDGTQPPEERERKIAIKFLRDNSRDDEIAGLDDPEVRKMVFNEAEKARSVSG